MRRNVPRLYFFSFFTMFFIALPVWVPYFQGKGFSMRDVFTVQAVFALAVALLEVPTGYFSDLAGRKKTLVAGAACYALSFTWLAFADTFWGVILFELGAALSFSLISGADVALMYDSLPAEASREERTRALGNMQSAQLFSEAGGALLGGYLASHALSLPFHAQAVAAWFPLLIALSLVEGPREVMKGSHRENFGLVFRHMLHHSAAMRRSSLDLLVWTLATFSSVWMLQKYWETAAVPVGWFGTLWAAGNLVAAFTSKSAVRFRGWRGPRATTLIACALPVVGFFLMGTQLGAVGISGFMGIYLGRGLIQVLMREEFNHHLPNEFRATANSVQSFLFRLVFAVVGPGLGWLIDVQGVQAVMLGTGVVFGLFYVGLVRRKLA